MITPALRSPITLTLQVSGTLYAALGFTAEMSEMTVCAVVATALREKAIGKSRSRPLPALQRAILDQLATAAEDSGVADSREVRQSMPHRFHPAAVSRGIRALLRSGMLLPMISTDHGFTPVTGSEYRARFVRRAPEVERANPRS